jgi:leader peptidase (prepilin peptidase) / N-methyltransferase
MEDIVIHCIFLILLISITVTIAIIDWKNMIVPDGLNFALAVTGLLFALFSPYPGKFEAILGMLAGGMIAFGLRFAYYRLRRYHGLGLGDVKFIAAAGAWTGVQALPQMLLIAALSALAYCFTSGPGSVENQNFTKEKIPFGPFLCAGLLVTAGIKLLKVTYISIIELWTEIL